MSDLRFVVVAPGGGSGQALDVWTSGQCVEDIFQPANHFSLRLALTGNEQPIPEQYLEKLCALAKPDAVVRLEVGAGNIPLMQGIIDERFINGDRAAEYIEVSGRDGASLLLDNEVSTKLRVSSGITLPALAEELLQRYRGKGLPLGIETSNDANRSVLSGKPVPVGSGKTVRTSRGAVPVKRRAAPEAAPPVNFTAQKVEDARPHAGETEWDFLSRHAKNLGLLMWMSARGNLVIARPDYNQPVRYQFRRLVPDDSAVNNILSGGQRLTVAGTATAIHILGHGALSRAKKRKVRDKVIELVRSPREAVFPRERYLKEGHVRTSAEAVRVGRHELAVLNANAEAYEYRLRGTEYLEGVSYTVDTRAHLRDELPRPAADLDVYVTRRGLTLERSGMFTDVVMTPDGAIQF